MLEKTPFAVSIAGMIGGVFIAILFGVNEGFFKDKINRGLQQNEKIMQIEDEGARQEKLDTEAAKNWRYYQRYHFHATGIGAMALAVQLMTLFIKAAARSLLISRYMVAIGGFLYPFVWLFAGIYGPVMGRSEAKEAFAIFGYSGGLFLVGLLFVLYLLLRNGLRSVGEGSLAPDSNTK